MLLPVTHAIICCYLILLGRLTSATIGGGCTADGDCTAENNEVCATDTCACNTGFGNDNGVCRIICTANDECTEPNEECDADDTGDGVRNCKCATGYIDNVGTCTVDECTTNPCQNAGACTNNFPGFTCTCATGWTGTTCTECTQNEVCGTNAVCSMTTCECDTGFTENTDGDCVADACTPNPCLNAGECANNFPEFTCTCVTGWTGTTCTECTQNEVCGTNAVCSMTTCECDTGFTENTDGDCVADACTPNPCLNAGECANNFPEFTCTCVTGWTGTTCTECTQNDVCGTNAVCDMTACECNTGFEENTDGDCAATCTADSDCNADTEVCGSANVCECAADYTRVDDVCQLDNSAGTKTMNKLVMVVALWMAVLFIAKEDL